MMHFGVINLVRNLQEKDIKAFIVALTQAGKQMGTPFFKKKKTESLCIIFDMLPFSIGMDIGAQLFIKNCQSNFLEREMRAAKTNFPDLQILFVIMDRKGDPAYGKYRQLFVLIISNLDRFFLFKTEVTKRVGDLDLLLTTQCIQKRNILGKNGPDRSTMANICLKLNAKLGGTNNVIGPEHR